MGVILLTFTAHNPILGREPRQMDITSSRTKPMKTMHIV
jgi:hypothetical protein